MSQTSQLKSCPQCTTLAAIDAQFCQNCGHSFSTSFAQPPHQPQGGPGYPQYPPHKNYQQPYGPQYPPGYVPPGYQQPYGPQYHPGYGAGNPDDIYVMPGTHPVALAAILSILCFVGCGQLVNRQYIKGIVMLAGAIVLSVLTAGLFAIIAWPVSIIDAIIIANRLNRGEVVRQWQFF